MLVFFLPLLDAFSAKDILADGASVGKVVRALGHHVVDLAEEFLAGGALKAILLESFLHLNLLKGG